MFHEFSTQEERRIFGGSAFIELQYCKMPKDTNIKKILSTKYAKYWENDSLYIYFDNIDLFIENYGKILNDGTYNNLKTGLVDICGYNYYNPIQVKKMIEKINEEKPIEYNKILKWLEKEQEFNGFYLSGI